jgi:thiol-disulfide isomerase/thioredoxin
MKNIALTAFALVFSAIIAAAQGIEFFHGPWAEALEKAKTEDKIIFVDAYASWCGPCKRMSSQVFPDPKSGEFYNANFVCLKIDMEKPENAEFAGKYPVGSYPTLMFIDAEGKIVLKDVGFREVDPFIEIGKKALGKVTKSVDYEKGYADGNRDPKFLYNYVHALNRTGQPSLKVTNEYLNTQTDLTSEFNLRFILEGAVESDSRVFDLLVKYQDKIVALAGKDAVASRIETACKNTVKKAIQFKSPTLLAEAKAKMKAATPSRAKSFNFESDLSYYAATSDAKNYLKTAKAFQKSEIQNNSAKLEDLVITLLRAFPDDPKVLDQAGKWAEKAAETGGLPEYFLTWAEILKKQGNKEKARATAQKGMEAIGSKDNGMKARIEYFLNSLG